jgi:hypothetical protein
MATFVAKEVPVGTIDGFNKTFQLANAASQIDDVFIDGAVYVDFAINGTILTLTDAPSLSVFVDYWYGGTPTTGDVTATYGEMKAEVWALLGQRSTSTTFSDAAVGRKINEITRKVCRGRYVVPFGPDAKRVFRCGKMWFMEGKYPIRVKGGSQLTADYDVGDSTIDTDTTYFLPSGYAQVGGETISYTSVSATQLMGVSGGTVQHLAGDPIIQLYQMPLAVSKPSAVRFVRGDSGQLGSSQIYDIEVPYAESDDTAPTVNYQIIRDASRQLMKVVGLKESDLLEVSYTRKFTDMTSDADECILPEDYGLTVVAPLVAGEMGGVRLMPAGATSMAIGTANLQAMYGDFGNVTTITKQSIKPIPYSKK